MLIKFESQSVRVKGLSFHHSRPWLLASLSNGHIQLWEYQKHVLLDKFEEHEGPVRCVNFHPKQPLFVSAGDDQKIKVWNYQQKRCLFTLLGHLDYIRTCFFHHEYPWIVSSSDDNTIRIWNWQSRSCVSVLTGHNHYVMCAQFHPKEDLVVSGSLDTTIRVWDLSGLRKKTVAPGQIGAPSRNQNPNRPGQPDLFGASDAVVKHILEGHDRGVNWVAFHPSHPLIVSAADDRTVKLWRYNEQKAVEMETFRGHFNNVSCVIFHPRQDLILSNSEDKHIRVWDMQGHTCVKMHRREKDRFWILSAHEKNNLFAAGHEAGIMVFKLERERPPLAMHGNNVYYVKDRTLRLFDTMNTKDNPVMSLKKPSGVVFDSVIDIFFNPAENAILLTSNLEGGSYELYWLPKGNESPQARRALGLSAVWVARNRFAVLDKSRTILIKDMSNEITKKITPAHMSTDKLFYAGTGSLLLRSEEHMNLYDLQQKQSVAECNISGVRHVCWSPDNKLVAFMCKHSVTICDRKLNQLCVVNETSRVKSGAWDESGVFIYTTISHIKYLLTNGDAGIIRTLDIPIYITAIKGTKVYCFDRDRRPRLLEIDPSEFKFKVALVEKKYDEVLYMVRTSKLIGQSIISYLQQKGYPEIALHFVTDEKARFTLALECGNIEVATESARKLDDPICWELLAETALKYGDHKVVEMAYQQTKNFEQLLFLYLITGNTAKLEMLKKVAAYSRGSSYLYQTALFLGDVEDRYNILENSGTFSLAYLTACTHNLAEEQARLQETGRVPNETGALPNAKYLCPPTPASICAEVNWPHLTVVKGMFDTIVAKTEGASMHIESKVNFEDGEVGDAWGGDDDLNLDDDGELVLDDVGEGGEVAEEDVYGGWDMEDDLDLPDGLDLDLPTEGLPEGVYALPAIGEPYTQKWYQNCNIPAEFVCAGDLETAMKLLNSSIGVINFEPLRPQFGYLLSAVQTSVTGMPSLPSLLNPVHHPDGSLRPCIAESLSTLTAQAQSGYQATTKGDFAGAANIFRSILHSIPLLCVMTKKDLTEAQQLISICREYVLGLSMELKRQQLPKTALEDVKRACELAAYFTHCDLQPAHLLLTLRVAATRFFQLKNFKSAQTFARRMLELGPPPAQAQNARKILAACQKNLVDTHTLNYDEHNPFSTCAKSFTPIYKGQSLLTCPYCSAAYLPEYQGQKCEVCQLSSIGKECSGLLISPHQRR